MRERERERERERIGVLKNRIEIRWGRREGWIDDEKSNLVSSWSPKNEDMSKVLSRSNFNKVDLTFPSTSLHH